jgi:hypothetical protein
MTEQTTPIIVPIVAFAVFFGVGVFLTFSPQRLQRCLTSESFQKRSVLARFRLYRWYVSSSLYIWEMRVWGVVTLLVSALIAWRLFTWPHQP